MSAVERLKLDMARINDGPADVGEVIAALRSVAHDYAREADANAASADKLSEQLAEMKRRLGFTYCAYCGEEFPLDGDKVAEAVGAHIRTCEKHPMRKVEAQLAEERKALAYCLSVGADCDDFSDNIRDKWGEFTAICDGKEQA